MSLQLPFESKSISEFLESRRNIVPSFRSGIGEASLTELALQIVEVHIGVFEDRSLPRPDRTAVAVSMSDRWHGGTADMHQMHEHA